MNRINHQSQATAKSISINESTEAQRTKWLRQFGWLSLWAIVVMCALTSVSFAADKSHDFEWNQNQPSFFKNKSVDDTDYFVKKGSSIQLYGQIDVGYEYDNNGSDRFIVR